MRILHIASEIEPFIKTGGLADVLGSLPKALKQLKNEIYIALPFYKDLINENLKHRGLKSKLKKIKTIDIKISLNNKELKGRVHFCKFQGINVFFVENNEFFNRKNLYTHIIEEDGEVKVADYDDNLLRFSFFAHSIFSIIKIFKLDLNIVHCHDWQAALVPILAKNNYKYLINDKTNFIFTIHNLAYQGIFPKEQWAYTKLPWKLFSMEDLEFWGDINLIKGAVKYSDIITTVSPTYAKEIQTKEYGFGLDGFLSQYSHHLHGVLNGIDVEYWNPKTDTFISNYNYDLNDTSNKLMLKMEFSKKYFKQNALPLIGMVSRLTEQKGIQFILEDMDKIMELPINLIILGSGNKNFENSLKSYEKKYADNFHFENGYNESLAHNIYGASDFFFMPSVFEPCGLGQMIAMRYGSIPIVRETGGLKDSIVPIEGNAGTGIVFKENSSKGIYKAINSIFNMDDKKSIMNNCMKINLSWRASAREYMKIYERGKDL
ncbi:glycogen synthase [bacterium]|nr:glycogen synthase [bacterium]